ncbi:hypothetical protein T4D_11172 [Trichinella pseudospiralis]|uniref:Uncharacterized protein n=1 Tax=Trichinella pseudospiralis TaxID=6337 RepID=A0A0V1F400_TRIPS|nr:hypothetical protein T4D_11172 [Trichinella pseudospiralis]
MAVLEDQHDIHIHKYDYAVSSSSFSDEEAPSSLPFVARLDPF